MGLKVHGRCYALNFDEASSINNKINYKEWAQEQETNGIRCATFACDFFCNMFELFLFEHVR